MEEPRIDPADLEIWAGYLLEHSLGGIEPGDRVMLKGERIAWPLLAVLERRVLEAGGIPDLLLVPPNNERGRVWSSAMARHGSADLAACAPDWLRARYETMNKYVEVLGAEEPSSYAGLTAEQTQLLATADRPFSALRLARRWVITLYPTPAQAASEGMTFDAYTRFLVRASTVDPRPLRAGGENLVPLVRAARRATIVTASGRGEHQLTMSLEPSLPVLSYGLRNFPDGEVFTSPDARSPEGEIFLDLPVCYGGVDIRGLWLRLQGGRIVDWSADEGAQQARAIIETDEGSRRLGELAFGLNPGLDRVLKHPLFVEKVGGTMHIAIGASYDNCFVEDPSTDDGRRRIAELVAEGVLNRSAQHVDVVTDFRPGGAGRHVFLDDRELRWNGAIWE